MFLVFKLKIMLTFQVRTFFLTINVAIVFVLYFSQSWLLTSDIFAWVQTLKKLNVNECFNHVSYRSSAVLLSGKRKQDCWTMSNIYFIVYFEDFFNSFLSSFNIICYLILNLFKLQLLVRLFFFFAFFVL